MSRSCRHLRNMLFALALWASIVLLGWHDSSLVLPLLCILLAMLAGRLLDSLLEMIFYGCWPARLRDQLAGELIKARLMKASRRFDEALEVVNRTLGRLPDHPEALLLKAQIMLEGFADHAAAKVCLRKILSMEPQADETVRQWAHGLLEEISTP